MFILGQGHYELSANSKKKDKKLLPNDELSPFDTITCAMTTVEKSQMTSC